LIESAEEKIRRLNPLIESAKKKLGELEDGFESAESLLAEIRRQRDDGHEIVDRLKTTMMDPLSELTDTEHQAVAQAAVLATDKSEGGQSWIDLWTLATDAYGREDFVEAAEYFAQVSEVAPTDTLVAHALLHQGASFAGLGRHEGAIRIFEKVIDRFGDAPDIGLRVLVATATLNKGVMLGKLSRQLDQVAVYDQLIKRFSDSDVPDIRDSVARAFNGKADSLRNIAKTKWVGGDMEAAQQDLTDAIGKLDSALKHNPELFLTLGNLAYTRHLLGEGGDAVRGPLKKALELGGEELYTETIIDIETHPVPEKDEAFRELLDTVWAEVQAEAKTPKGD
jgi:tetratricopeptide (TPR) repeat protein